jgi:tetratricopeptide (TPR) repeat protein
MEQSVQLCRSCGTSLPVESRFCPSCGRRVRRDISVRARVGALLLGLGVWGLGWGGAWFIQQKEGRTKPTTAYSGPPVRSEKVTSDPALDALRKQAEAAPSEDLQPLKSLGLALIEKSRAEDESSPSLALEAIDVFGRVLERAPNDPVALLALADVSFDQRVFDKAVEYYRKYLEVLPDDMTIRARYASALSFVGKPDDAMHELQAILARDPNNFQAHAYLSIAYSQKGERELAKQAGEKALSLAPSPEAKERLGQFLTSLDASTQQTAQSTAPAAAPQQAGAGPDAFTQWLKQHPVLGPKVVRVAQGDGRITLIVKEFPMHAMPPFAKEKLNESLRTHVPAGVERVGFVDDTTGELLGEFEVKK